MSRGPIEPWAAFRRRQDLRYLLGRCVGRRGRLPDFLGVGAQKAGTTTLHRMLAAHPGVRMPAEKELHYFTHHAHRPRAWYADCFAGLEPGGLAGEITPYYLFHPFAPERIAAALPGARVIILLRDPVERALSHYFHSVRLGRESLPLEEALRAEDRRLAGEEEKLARPGESSVAHVYQSYVARSRYDRQLPRWQARFPREHQLILRSEDFFREPAPVWRRVQDFLGLAAVPLPDGPRIWNEGGGAARRVDSGVRRALRERLDDTYRALARDPGLRWEPAPGEGAEA